MSDNVWYACYGSNLLEKRFLCYIRGGQAPGGLISNPGARDQTLPMDTRPYEIDRAFYFGASIPQWQGGGVGFIENNPVSGICSYGRIYKITNEQFDDVVFQENGMKPGVSHMKIARPAVGQSCDIFDSIYGRVICLEEIEGSPVFTFTRPVDIPVNQRRRPSLQYLKTIIAGLLESRPGIEHGDVVSYFMNTEAREFGPEGILDILTDLESEE